MIEAHEFVRCAQIHGFSDYAGVPCSFLSPFINYVIEQGSLRYLSAANEGDAVAFAAGTYLGGRLTVAMMQNSGLGNAVSPLTSLTYTFQIPVLLIITLRGDPGLVDEPQHALMGRITGTLLETMEIPWAYFPREKEEIDPALTLASDYLRRYQRPYGLILRKGSVAPHSGAKQRSFPKRTLPASIPSRYDRSGTRISRTEALQRILSQTPPEKYVVIATTGYTGRELFALEDRPNQLYMVGSMGCASSLGLGLSLARPDLQVVVIEGDGAALMRLGNLATVGTYGSGNFTHIILDNEAHDSTGAQATVSGNVSFAQMASACGYSLALEGTDPKLLDRLFTVPSTAGPRFAQLKIRPGTLPGLPRPTLTPPQIQARLRNHLGK